jgi:hypothetical protein
MNEQEKQTIEDLQREVTRIAAENFAQQLVLTCFFQRLGQVIPGSRITILQALDDAADHAERFSIASDRQAGHLPETSASSSKCG